MAATTSVTSSPQTGASAPSTLTPEPEIVTKIRELVKDKTKIDPYLNCNIDLSAVTEFTEEEHAKALGNIVPDLIASAKNANSHILTIKISTLQADFYKSAVKAGLDFHHAEDFTLTLFKCLKDHKPQECSYPKYRPLSFGVTGVIFNDDLSEFLAIQEEIGPYKGWKAPTAIVDYGPDGELPWDAIVRKIADETKVSLKSEDATLVAAAWTNNLRGRPDENHVYAFRTNPKSHQLDPKKGEIRAVKWLSTQEFLEMQLPVSHDKPLILKEVVVAAHRALKENQGWKPQLRAWGSGIPVTVWSARS